MRSLSHLPTSSTVSIVVASSNSVVRSDMQESMRSFLYQRGYYMGDRVAINDINSVEAVALDLSKNFVITATEHEGLVELRLLDNTRGFQRGVVSFNWN